MNLWKTDRKSTRLNSSHGYNSYAVFCLKKKRIVGTRFQPAQAAGASTSRTTGTVLTSSCLISNRLPLEPPDRRFAQALSSPLLKRAAAALLSHSVYHTSAAPPALPPRVAFLRPRTR